MWFSSMKFVQYKLCHYVMLMLHKMKIILSRPWGLEKSIVRGKIVVMKV